MRRASATAPRGGALASPARRRRAAPRGRAPFDALAFEALVSELSGSFAGAQAEHIDAEIRRWLGKLGDALGVDRVTLFQPSGDTLLPTHRWTRAGRTPPPRIHLPEFPWSRRALEQRKVISFSALRDLPPEASSERRHFERAGVGAAIVVPLRIDDSRMGSLALSSMRPGRIWAPRLLRRLETVAGILASALDRKSLRDEGHRYAAQSLKLRDQLAHMARVASLGELAASLAHELSQPLMAVLNNAQAAQRILSRERPDLGEVRAALADIVASDKRAGEVLRRMRAMFRQEPVERGPIDVAATLAEILRLLSPDALAHGVTLTVDVGPGLPRVAGDAVQIQQVVMNLVLNAIDAMAAASSARRDVVLGAALRSPDQVAVVVRDTGPGFPEELRARLFEPFFTTKPRGMGMGLAIARSIVEAHGGRLDAASVPGGGAAFEVTLPVAS